MLEKIKISFGRVTVKVTLAALLLAFVSQYLTWLTDGKHSQSLVEAFKARPEYFTGVPQMLLIGLLWVAICFLLNHPKLSLVGTLLLMFMALLLLFMAMDYGISLGIGFFLYVISTLICVVMAFKTKKIKKEK